MRAWQRARNLRGIPTRDLEQTLTPDRTGPVWSRWLDWHLARSFVRYHREGKKLQRNGQSGTRTQHEWLAKDLKYQTGCERSPRQRGTTATPPPGTIACFASTACAGAADVRPPRMRGKLAWFRSA
ncbi:hypothetical protein AURDEDRAFT_121020 [Auricularia subglabra TFB-10046 SS5]|nr:hypothetical protein AURDEDRAFT_121020 [Auricularia subglabra TFB-10046 SS5]